MERLTRSPIPAGIVPVMWFDPRTKYSRLLDKLVTKLGKSPFNVFPSKVSIASCVQFIKEERNIQSPASSQWFWNSISFCKLSRDPKEGITPVKEF